MNLVSTAIKDLIIIEPKIFSDKRGYFFEPFNYKLFNKKIGNFNFVQDNESKSSIGVLRGFHFQRPPFEQTKLVRCIQGEVLDVALDLRKNSVTYGKFEKVILSGENKRQLLIPKGFAHAFIVLSKSAIFSYKVDNDYSPDHDDGIIWNDKTLNVDWKIISNKIKISEKDQNLNSFLNFNSPF